MSITIYDNSTYLFPDSGEYARECLFQVFKIAQVVGHGSVQVEFYIAILGVLVTFCHLVVLTRKAMITSSVITIMMGVAVFDLLSMAIMMKSKSMLYETEGTDCSPPATLLSFRIFWFFIAIRDMVHRSSTWLGVLMALIRFAGLRFAMNPSFLRMSKPRFGMYAVVGSLVPSAVLSVFYWLRYNIVEDKIWKPKTNCSDYSPSTEEPSFTQKPSALFTWNDGIVGKSFMIINGLTSKILPCILLPLLTGLLISQLRQAKKTRELLNSPDKGKSTEKTTVLVIFMAISFFIAEIPIGTALIFQVAYTEIGFLLLATYVNHLCNLLFTLNSIIHCIIFFVMSSQYRKTVRKFIKGEKSSEVASEYGKRTVVSVAIQNVTRDGRI